jgi:adenylate kinase family enzyme
VIQYRLDVYDEQTRPVLERYPLGKIARVNATQPPEQVTADILQSLKQKGVALL